jgi:hypothetical protein
MTRRIVYGISLWVYLGAFACSIAAVALPNWISYTSPTDNDPIHVSYGLHKRCSSITGQCTPFPQDTDCYGDDRSFCSMWRSTGFLMNFSIIFEVAVLVAYLVILVGGRGTREVGWKILSPLLLVVAAAQLGAMTLVVGLIGGKGDAVRWLHMLTVDIGLPLRSRQPLLCWVVFGQVVDSLHCQLDCHAARCCWCSFCGLPPCA